jgi:hypothetical protein
MTSLHLAGVNSLEFKELTSIEGLEDVTKQTAALGEDELPEPISATVILTLTTAAATAFSVWVVKKRNWKKFRREFVIVKLDGTKVHLSEEFSEYDEAPPSSKVLSAIQDLMASGEDG